MPKVEARLTQEEKAFIIKYCSVREFTESGLVRYAIKRYCSTNAVKGLTMPDGLKMEITHKKGD